VNQQLPQKNVLHVPFQLLFISVFSLTLAMFPSLFYVHFEVSHQK